MKTKDQGISPCAYLQQAGTSEPVRLLYRSLWYLRNQGAKETMKQFGIKLGLLSSSPSEKSMTIEGEVLGLEAGEWVEVKREEKIRPFLNRSGKYKGLLFMPEMWKFCGKRFRVYKRVNTILVESTGKRRKIRNTVLLEGVHCDGSEHFDCDSSCFHFWREAWLRRAEPEKDDK